jgi:hypothetical protein
LLIAENVSKSYADDVLKDLGFFSAGAFREKILLGIENSQEEIGTWLPEWYALQQVIEST